MLLLFQVATAFVVDVPPRTEECYIEKGSLGEEMHFSYEVFQGGFLDVDITVKSLKKGKVQETVFEKSRTTNGKTSWEVLDDLEYELCFSNQISTLAHKKLFFAIHKDTDVHKALADSKSVDPLNGLATDLEEKVQQAKDQLQYMAIRENRHQQTNHNTNVRVTVWSIIEVCTVACVCLLQVCILKQFFEVKQRI